MKTQTMSLLILFVAVKLHAQQFITAKDYQNPKDGIYINKSKSLNHETYIVISPDKNFKDSENIGFLYPEKNGIALFDRVNDKGTDKPVGILKEPSIVLIDSVFYNEIYKDTTKEWAVTFNVWYSLRINGKRYYSDYQIHDFLAYKVQINELKQLFLLIAQSTGYDYNYDLGYPNNFFVMILNSNREEVFTSEIFDYDYADEFLITELEYVTSEFKNGSLTFTINGAYEKFIGTWTGKELLIK